MASPKGCFVCCSIETFRPVQENDSHFTPFNFSSSFPKKAVPWNVNIRMQIQWHQICHTCQTNKVWRRVRKMPWSCSWDQRCSKAQLKSPRRLYGIFTVFSPVQLRFYCLIIFYHQNIAYLHRCFSAVIVWKQSLGVRLWDSAWAMPSSWVLTGK